MGFVRVAGALVCVLVLTGCALGADGEARQVSRDELAIMVLPLDELGAEYAGFEPDDDAGPGTAADVADGTADPSDTAASVKQAGWRAGYDLTYSDPVQKPLAAKQRHGALSVGTSADLFATETDARAFIVGELADFERFVGKRLDGVKLLRFDTFDASAGDEAWGAEFAFRGGDMTFRATGVLFRHGRLVGSTFYLRLDDSDMRAQSVTLAQALDRRIEQVLAGELDAEPVPLPATEDPVTTAELSKMTLSAKDLPAGAVVTAQRRSKTDGGYASYYRDFDVSNTMIGRSHLLSLRAQTQVFETTKDAERFIGYLATAKGRDRMALQVQRSFKRVAAARARNLDVLALPNAGPNATGFVVTFDLPTGRYRIASIFVRSGRAVATVSGFCTAHAVHPDDMPPLGHKARDRLASIPV